MTIKDKDFVHLHVHTDYSIRDGAAKIPVLMKEAKNLGQTAIAMTDHGNMFGAFDFYKHAKANSIKPILGLEAYVTPGTARTDRESVFWGTYEQRRDDVSAKGTYTHLTVLAEDNEGLANLIKGSSIASLDTPFSQSARWDIDLLERFSKGVIAFSGCPSSEIQTRLRLDQFDKALKAAADMQDLFGKENFFIELMEHGIELEKRTRSGLLEIAKKLNAPLVATNDLHYVKKEDSITHEALLCLNSGAKLTDPTTQEELERRKSAGERDLKLRFAFNGEGYYLKSSQEMEKLFSSFPEALSNTLLIAERCNAEFVPQNHMPRFPIAENENEHDVFERAVWSGLNKRFNGEIPEDAQERAKYEMEVITTKDYPSYFLVVADFIKWAKENGIRVGPGRGSAVGSMVAYAMGITELNPIKEKLLFERFLNPERMSMPDIDVDFEQGGRDEVIK
jgi:DNA polymerase-3 subunit alpha